MKGISETSGMNEDEVMVLNAGMILLTIQILSGAPPSACSGVAAWNEYTPDGTLVFGRNWDIDRESMLDYMEFLGIVVFHPTDGLAVANIHPIGNLYLETGMNERGIFLELNNGEQSDSNFNEEAEDTSSVLLRVLSSCSSMNDAVEMLCAEPADVSYIIQVADSSSAVSVERATFGYRVREGKEDGLLAAYNSFVPPFPSEWQGLINPPPSAMQDPRLENLRNLANSPEFKGHLNAEKMMDLMDVRMEDGGAVHDGTVVQVIAIPETRTVWFRGLEYSDWEKVELDELFNMK